jgi:hypothetical protein
MKFSLKDLFWSVTLASFAAGALTIAFKALHTPLLETGLGQLIPLLLLTPGLLFGLAVGKLFHSVTLGFWLGLFSHAVTMLALMAKLP